MLILFSLLITFQVSAQNFDNYTDFVKSQKRASIQGHRISYIDHGEGTPIVLMHGIPTSSWMYRKLIPLLAQNGFRVIAPDLLGMGSSQKIKEKAKLLVPYQAKVMHELLVDHLQLKNWIQVVHDFGGPVIWEMLKFNDFNLDYLVVLDTFLFEEGWNHGLNTFSKLLINTATTKPLRKVFYTQAIKSMLFKPDQTQHLSDLLEGYVTPLLQGASYTYKTLYFSVKQLTDELPRYQQNLSSRPQIPSTIIWGKHDKFLSSEKQLKKISLHLGTLPENILILQKGKHLITEDAPGQIVEEILKCCKSL